MLPLNYGNGRFPKGDLNCRMTSLVMMVNSCTQTPNVALSNYPTRYMANKSVPQIKDADTILPGASPITIARYQCCTTGKLKEGKVCFSDSSKLEVPSLEEQADRAGVALSYGSLIIIPHVAGPQTSIRSGL